MSKSVVIYGAKSLERFTVGPISASSRDIVDVNTDLSAVAVAPERSKSPTINESSPALLVQLHGAPHAKDEDRLLLDLLVAIFKAPAPGLRLAVLIHRPDEIVLLHSVSVFELSASAVPPMPVKLVFMGDMHVNDACYKIGNNVSRHVVPHCFFDLTPRFRDDMISVGSFTTWGEMRSVEGVLKLLIHLFEQLKKKSSSSLPVVGYLGGRPAADLEPDRLRALLALETGKQAKLLEAKSIKSAADLPAGADMVILIDRDGEETLTATFNTQMYHLGNAVRTGESSGSVHATSGIPVILEMNGAEVIEDLRVVKVPYGVRSSMQSVDYAAGAAAILGTIADGSYKDMLRHNEAQAAKFKNIYSARAYASLFNNQ